MIEDSHQPELDALAASPARRRVRFVLVALCVLAVPLTLMRDWQLVWQPLLPIPLFFATPRVVVRVLAVATFALLLIGGAVTTYRVGMAVPDWPSTFQQNMWTYPLDEMLAEGKGVTLEHTHRLWASAVGLIAVCLVIVCLLRRAKPSLSWLSVGTLAAIIGQGLLGGTRVLENSQNLAFLHGAFAQLVYALVAALVVVSSRAWDTLPRHASGEAQPLRKRALIAVAIVYAQIVLGAWLRHSGSIEVLGVHGAVALVAFIAVVVLASTARRIVDEGRENGHELRPLQGSGRLLVGALLAQITLGVLATVAIYSFSGGFDGAVSVGEAVFATLHVAVGALLLAACVAVWLWSHRALAVSGERTSNLPVPQGGAA